ncbi:ubiquinone biosynthesis methyltransferase [Babesia microti strain RI]|uniref:2-methoxy-6-polyprenyl-1,4-benzoquinol methylase, mitochondrial n=1 Tax=Babesia microti (strain RI) TaxID=1133968 RepID=A0A1N6LXT4_BABMR|nr:ubiquinone biosynthesis methyltransferase [Babesia microti strain RI]SIO73685.1 ubiquinone biosynthesis methyltransferase [Babesia microti strain RI]|eukprot:XP_012649943.2 ubiquinone biosynthesis methyltransferase [Babesia microti strain RI]
MDKLYNVRDIFKSVASKYDFMNDLMSFGVHRFWKDCLVGLLEPKLISHWQSVERCLLSSNRGRILKARVPKLSIIDLAGGTGDIAFRINDLSNHLAFKTANGFQYHCEYSRKFYPKISIVDVSEEMIAEGKRRYRDQYGGQTGVTEWLGNSDETGNVEWILGPAEEIPLEDSSADIITIAFGARNFDNLSQGLLECKRVLKPNGELYILEFSKCKLPVLSALYSVYSHLVIPKMGKVVANDEDAYQYLVDSIEAFPGQLDFAKIIEDCGFHEVSHLDLSGGIVAIHKAVKR